MINFHELEDVHLAAVLVKTFLRELKEPLVPFEHYDNVLKCNGNVV